MNCPICRTDSLEEISLDVGLLARKCNQCSGHWLSSEHYWTWLDSQKSDASGESHNSGSHHAEIHHAESYSAKPTLVTLNSGLLPVADNETANFCADCARLMRKARVGKGLSFYIDRCSYCHGVWLDQNEWENLKTMNMHHRIPYVFSDSWQYSIRHEQLSQHKVSPNLQNRTPATVQTRKQKASA
ncbi:zf-TFIIB domain-containing protein [cf. Phormidesmis sp. LEGE 11477]|uniref:TFIIB-type zinc ribbon-containing protein n=1 Tax=cf. Phormidesmis sp. LEGE 11477 TaxID=1828680 RepID=UPI001881028C|nr:zf-TFIIB domain-containing protein [cf. Phormidesmis sp. LEGE 11477]MBE9060837.1 zf-TFIIB domain-containing protein [cf. Phormidesmis sp. LEGE 11477]